MQQYPFTYSYEGSPEIEGTIDAESVTEARQILKDGIQSAHGDVKDLKISVGRKPVSDDTLPRPEPLSEE